MTAPDAFLFGVVVTLAGIGVLSLRDRLHRDLIGDGLIADGCVREPDLGPWPPITKAIPPPPPPPQREKLRITTTGVRPDPLAAAVLAQRHAQRHRKASAQARQTRRFHYAFRHFPARPTSNTA